MRYYIADCHFYHKALLDHMDCRGFDSVESMNEYMIEQWNKKVRKNDEVVILGDLSWGNLAQTQQILDQLRALAVQNQGGLSHAAAVVLGVAVLETPARAGAHVVV